ncbi:unnamed protein product [Dibothriocephalus latus]|uniref:Peptidase S1 domain-containing protein n=1 Tax=Dibothriocephalus latus TaxID=60516 RepID=A0A3P6QVL0_DIBLA|nr:unnamed protein product [Dibothriocephalus latus]
MAVTVADHKHTQRQRPTYNVRVKGVIMHPSFIHHTSKAGYDIALLQLNREVKRMHRTLDFNRHRQKKKKSSGYFSANFEMMCLTASLL